MKLLSIDPGRTVGLAIISSQGVERTWTLSSAQFLVVGDEILQEADLVVFETVVSTIESRRYAKEMSAIRAKILEFFSNAPEINPGLWKSSKYGTIELNFKPATKHEEDAARLGLFYMSRLVERMKDYE